MLTYGDGVANINVDELLKFHKKHGKLITVTSVHPGSRYGELCISKDKVTSFKEKPQLNEGWVNGGFFVVEPNRPPAISGDFDGNLKVNFSDFLIFVQGYARSEGDEGYIVQLDLDGDGMVGFSDFVAFARLYGT